MKFFVKKYFTEEGYEKGRALLEEMARCSREEKGCIYYDLYQDADDPKCIVLLEAWEREEDQVEHMKSSHFKELIPQINALLRKEFPLSRFVELK